MDISFITRRASLKWRSSTWSVMMTSSAVPPPTLFWMTLGDAHMVIAEDGSDSGQYARSVFYFHTYKIAVPHLVDGLDPQILVAGTVDSSGAARHDVPGHLENVACYRTAGRKLSGSAALDMASPTASPCTKTALKESLTPASG